MAAAAFVFDHDDVDAVVAVVVVLEERPMGCR